MERILKNFKEVLARWAVVEKPAYEAEPWPSDRVEQFENERAKGYHRKTGVVIADPKNFDAPKWIFRFERQFTPGGEARRNVTLDGKVWMGVKLTGTKAGWYLDNLLKD